MSDTISHAQAWGFPVVKDSALPIDAAAARLLADHPHAVAVAVGPTTLDVVLDHVPTAAQIRALETLTGYEAAVSVADAPVFAHLHARANDPDQVSWVIEALTSLPLEVDQVLLRTGSPIAAGTARQSSALTDHPTLTATDVDEAARWLAGDQDERVVPFAGRHWRVNVSTSNGSPVVSLRHLRDPQAPAAMSDLGLPAMLAKITDLTSGLVLIASPPRGGRTTTASSVVDRICATRSAWVSRVVDADEHVTADRRSQVTTRIVGVDTNTAADAINAALRDSTTVLVLDVATLDGADVVAATRAALAGLLVIATIPAASVTDAAAQWMLPVPAEARPATFAALAGAWRLGAAQQLLADRAGGLVPAVELWWSTPSMVAALHDGDLLSMRTAAYDNPSTDGLRNTDMEAAVAALVSGGRVAARDDTRTP